MCRLCCPGEDSANRLHQYAHRPTDSENLTGIARAHRWVIEGLEDGDHHRGAVVRVIEEEVHRTEEAEEDAAAQDREEEGEGTGIVTMTERKTIGREPIHAADHHHRDAEARVQGEAGALGALVGPRRL